MTHEDYLQELSKVLGIRLTFDEDNNCLILIENTYTVCVQKDESNERFVFLGNVADALPDPIDYSVLLDLLNFGMAPVITGGPAVGRDPDSGIISAWAFLPLKNLSVDDFLDAFTKFIQFQVTITDLIAGEIEDDDESFDIHQFNFMPA